MYRERERNTINILFGFIEMNRDYMDMAVGIQSIQHLTINMQKEHSVERCLSS